MVQEIDAVSLHGCWNILLEQILSEAVRDVSLLRWQLLSVEFIRIEDWDRVIAIGRWGARQIIVNRRVNLLLRIHLKGWR